MLAAPWFVDAFTSSYLEVYSRRDETSARREAKGALNLLRHDGSKGPLLDLAAGARRCAAIGLPTVRGDMRALPFRDGAFAAVTCLFSSFGYFDDEAEHVQTLC